MPKDLKVTKSNHIIEASYRLTLQEQRLILACLAKVDSSKEIPKTISLTDREYACAAGLHPRNARRELYKAADGLYEASIKIRGPEETAEFRWVQTKVKSEKGEGRVTLTWGDTVLKYISQLRERFTSYKLKYIAQLQSPYSIRLYELLMQFGATGERRISVDDLRDILKLKGKYPLFRDLNKRVIKASVAELNQRSDLIVTYATIKRGRNVTGLKFDFSHSGQTKPPG